MPPAKTKTVEPQAVLEQARFLNYKTPFFFTSRGALRKNYHLFTHLFDSNNSIVYYALKANSDPKILNYLNDLGCGFEAASAYEIKLLLDLGVDPSRIIYGTSIKPAEHIDLAYKAGIHCYAADSKEEIDKLAKYAPGSKVFVRTIVDDNGSVFTMSERFGAPASQIKDIVLYAHTLDLKLFGLSFYVGSQAAHADMWAKGVRTVKPIIEELLKVGISLEVLNIGGGFPVHYDNHKEAPSLHDIVVNVHNALHELPYMPKIMMEPGRGLVATTTVLVSEVVARSNRGGKPWLCLDAGIYNALFEAMLHQGATRYPVHLVNPPTTPAETRKFTLAGPTGDSLDIIARDVELPEYVGIGDKLMFENAGAYTIAMASRFNGFPEPPLYIS
jgi:ornithine decarboxylase